ncbi:interferon-induced gtp-binding protein mx2 [Colletotrichum incanum]|uniref:Interferon-induced gtp-binding protein mx2 n=1 Tax=Colletotrichum incanum TaxID=1573173 RepID=A0A161Y9V9_COLIC|nr:interferon-induced gtp-binding protein mx2 [Colletotrichum incanum]
MVKRHIRDITNRGGDNHGKEDDTLTALREREAIFLNTPKTTFRRIVSLLRETRQKLANAEKKIKDLGAPRQTEHKQQQYLNDIASNFQILVCAALNADYSAHPAFNSNELRLITAVFNTTEQFSTNFYNFGRKSLFESETKIAPPVPGGVITLVSPVFYDDEEEQEEKTEEDSNSSLQLNTFNISTPRAFLELERIIVID